MLLVVAVVLHQLVLQVLQVKEEVVVGVEEMAAETLVLEVVQLTQEVVEVVEDSQDLQTSLLVGADLG
jgi:hypothetical protein